MNRHARLVLKHVAGWACLVLGVVMLVTPGQGVLTILLGVYLLADHIPFFGRLRDWIHRRYPRFSAYVHHTGQALRERLWQLCRRP